jgi:hypothetical protein
MYDPAMKMLREELAFVDGLYATIYALPNELLRVGSKCSSSSARPDSFHPAEAVARRERASGVSSESPIVPAHAPLKRERILGSRSPHSPW